jgi:hypothetical protein
MSNVNYSCDRRNVIKYRTDEASHSHHIAIDIISFVVWIDHDNNTEIQQRNIA